MIIKNGLVFTEEQQFLPLTIQTENDLIISVSPSETAPAQRKDSEPVIDASGCYVIPGLTDIHFHGCDGYDFCDNSIEAYEAIAAFCLKNGVTSICPATMTMPLETLEGICKTAASFSSLQSQKGLDTDCADLIGIHMEGPFISKEKKGAQNEAYILAPDSKLVERWLGLSGGLVKLISLAPEVQGAISCIEECRDKAAFSIAHTTADYATAKAAMEAGADHVTHLFNAMPPFHHRDSGVIGAAFDTENCYVELICDGIHISAPVVRAAFRLFEGRVILISDSMRATGKPDGTYTLGGQDVTVRKNSATLSDGTIAGSVTPLYRCMLTAVSMGIPLETAVASATINPCRSIGMDREYGSIAPGKKAHFLLLDQETLQIKRMIKGKR
ncbi:MAG: N-acetylglucosamine-6-phosphate deacetylase [Roseburia sp.]|nr:N-acetylglucosamine-6-phosphate deacetylase [Roseburia sp.]